MPIRLRFLVLAVAVFSAFELKATVNPRAYDALHYKLGLQLDPFTEARTFQGRLEVKVQVFTKGNVINFDAQQLTIHQVKIKRPIAKVSKFKVLKNELQVIFPRNFRKGEIVVFEIDYSAPISRTQHYGMFQVTDPDSKKMGPLLFTHLEPKGARRFFPCNDIPSDKATTELLVTVPQSYQAISNGKKVKETPVKVGRQFWKTFHWKMEQPHSTYLVSLAVAPYQQISKKVNGTELSVWIGREKLKQAKFSLELTAQSFDFVEKYLRVRYPWPKYDTISVPTFIWGGMENTSSTHINQDRLIQNDPNSEIEKKNMAGLIAHEVAHQWFGNLVTMEDWGDLWLNESFASYFDTLTSEHLYRNESPTIDLVTHTWDVYFREEDGPRSHPIVNPKLQDAQDSFDATTYTKGENILRMLNYTIGEDKFKRALRDYLQRNRFKNTSYKDFFASVKRVYGNQMIPFQESWLLKRGYPILSYDETWDERTNTHTLKLHQRPNHKTDKHLFQFKLPVVYHRTTPPAYEQSDAVTISQENTQFNKILPAPPEWVTVNPKAIVLAKLRQKTPNVESLTKQLKKDPDPVSRLWAATQLVSPMTDQSKVLSKGTQHLISVALKSDPSPYVRSALLESFQKMKERWLPSELSESVFHLAEATQKPSYEQNQTFQDDVHGWRRFRSEILGTLGKVRSPKAMNLLAETLRKKDISLDDLSKASLSVALLGDVRTIGILNRALRTHEDRGYRYRYFIELAFGAYESPRAAVEIEKIARKATPDLMGRIGSLVRNNETLKQSKEWPRFLQAFILYENRFGDEVKSRLLRTIEDVKTKYVESLLVNVTKKSSSERIKKVSLNILKKNFKHRTKKKERILG